MHCHLSRTRPWPTHAPPVRLALYSNLWPTATNRADRETLGVWYVDLHLYPFRVELAGPWAPRRRRSEATR